MLLSNHFLLFLFLSPQNIFVYSKTSNPKISFVGWHLYDVRIYFDTALFLAAIIGMKILCYQTKQLTHYIPESSIFLMTGVVFGISYNAYTVIKAGDVFDEKYFELFSTFFSFFILPPIILEASVTLCNRVFFDIILAVLFFAFIGTVLNFLIIASSSLFVYEMGCMDLGLPAMQPIDFLWFASILIAVDPVAVLAIFEECKVDQKLYFYVFGESLFNDAASVVLFNMIVSFERLPTIDGTDIVYGVMAFTLSSLGGASIGIFFGLITCLLTRITNPVPMMEPGAIFCLAYLSYILADIIQWSGLISLITCGIIQTYYALHNVHPTSAITIHRTIKMTASICESTTFFGIGFLAVHQKFYWFPRFTLWSLLFMVMSRFIVCFASCFCLNITGVLLSNISLKDQFFMSYGGLRGAIACTLAMRVVVKTRNRSKSLVGDLFHTSSIFIIVITIIVIGFTMRPLMKLMHVKTEEEHQLCIFNVMGGNVCDHLAAGIEAIVGKTGRNAFRERIMFWDIRYIRPILQNSPDSHDEKIVKEYENVSLAIHYASIKPKKEQKGYLSQLHENLQMKIAKKREENSYEKPIGILRRGSWSIVDLPEWKNCDEQLRLEAKEKDESYLSPRHLHTIMETLIAEDRQQHLRQGQSGYDARLRIMLHRRSKNAIRDSTEICSAPPTDKC